MFAPKSAEFLAPVLFLIAGLALLLYLHVVPWSPYLAAALVLCAGFWTFFALFFRDPERTPGEGIVAPADGRVLSIEREGERLRVATFMNVTNVHVNRFPIDGRVEAIETSGAGYRPAYVPDARHNLQRRYTLSTAIGPVDVVQMTGLIAKRIVSFVGVGAEARKGERFGMIVLGSRVDLILPTEGVEVVVRPGERVRAGVSTIAREKR